MSTWNTFLCYINLFLLTWNTISCNINTFLSKQNYFLCNVKLFILTQNYFLCNTKFLFWTSFMLCYGNIFLWSNSSKNKITCQKINKLSFLCETKKLIFFFVHHHFLYLFFTLHIVSMLIFFVVVLETKKLWPPFTNLSDIYRSSYELRASPEKRFLILMFVTLLRGSHILVKLQACFPQISQKLIP